MRRIKISAREWSSSSNRYRGDDHGTAVAINRSEFSPVFWLGSAPRRLGALQSFSRPWARLTSLPIGYPLVIAGLLLLVFFLH